MTMEPDSDEIELDGLPEAFYTLRGIASYFQERKCSPLADTVNKAADFLKEFHVALDQFITPESATVGQKLRAEDLQKKFRRWS